MAGSVRNRVTECLDAFLRLRSKGSDVEIDSWVRALASRAARGSYGPAGESRSRPFVLADAEGIEVPEQVYLASVQRAPTRAPISFPEHAAAAADLPAPEVYKRIAHLIDYVTDQIRRGERPYLDLPDLHRSNAIYD